ncbi:MAG: 4-hydroxy-tetrahydrodipicolinate reductase [Bacteroidales bacterium]|nr:4-hydroxy-tetrahydrodipicolinate reductase [Bacteroidales bacterium]
MKIALIGYGKMGHIIENIALTRGHEIVAIIDKDNQEDFTSEAFKSADVAIEFSMPSAALENYHKCFAANIPVVAGTTGWIDKMPEIKNACKDGKQTFFYASNYSIGVNIFFELNKHLAHIMNNYPAYNVRMEEVHHVHKLDSPSGTAISLADGIIENMDSKQAWVEGVEPKENEIGITSFRRGEVPGIHTIIYESDVDTISITHDAKSREGFALGAVVAAEYLNGKKGFHTMADLMKF